MSHSTVSDMQQQPQSDLPTLATCFVAHGQDQQTLRHIDTYTHDSLDYSQQSIRLICVQPYLSPEGLIQCTIEHATVDTPFVCLSYRWGGELPAQAILVNGKVYSVRENLFEFLERFRKRGERVNRIWIDAICIDQANFLERNHQVAQMGLIFSSAQCVYVWLGVLHTVEAMGSLLWQGKIVNSINWIALKHSGVSILDEILGSQYWERAWVTQEILLPRLVHVLVGTRLLKFPDFLRSMDEHVRSLDAMEKGAWRSKYSTFASYLKQRDDLRDQRLAILVDQFRDRKCADPHDHIYSLLALCAERESIRVDYNMPVNGLVHHVLSVCRDTLCICFALRLGATIAKNRLSQDIGLIIGASEDTVGPVIEFEVLGLSFKYGQWKTGATRSTAKRSIEDARVTCCRVEAFNVALQDHICPTLHLVLRRLSSSAIMVRGLEGSGPLEMAGLKHVERIEIPASLRHGEYETANHVHMYSNGFSFGKSPSRGITRVRIALRLLWSSLSMPQDDIRKRSYICSLVRICDHVRGRKGMSSADQTRRVEVAYGHWNTNFAWLHDNGRINDKET
jgi:hypothetical protein